MDHQIRVKGCPLCDIFLDPKNNLKTKLYYPEKVEDIPKAEFIIVDCLTCKTPMVIYGEHITQITRESWGRILYRSRRIFGGGITLRCKGRRIFDHHHCHIMGINKI